MLDPRRTLTSTVRVARRTRRSLLTRSGLLGATTELAWSAAHLALYPFGLLTDRDNDRCTVDDLAPRQRALLVGDVEAAGTPIVLVHGMVDNRSIFTVLRRTLRQRGFTRVVTLNYSPFTQDVATAAARLALLVERTCESTGYDRVHVVGHSMGGVVARYYVQQLGGDARVHTLVTLGSPHAGTRAAHLLPVPLTRQLRPGSPLLTGLDLPAQGCRTRFVAIWSDIDHMMVPKRAARLEHRDLTVRNVLVRGVGHMSLPIDRRVLHEIAMTLGTLPSEQAVPAAVPVVAPDRLRLAGQSG